MAKRGRKAIDFDEQMIAQVEAFASRGLSVDEIAHNMGMGRSTVFQKISENSDLSDAIKKGRAQGIAQVSNALFESAIGGNVTAMIFYLKTRNPEQWPHDPKPHINDDPPTPVKVVFQQIDGRVKKAKPDPETKKEPTESEAAERTQVP